MNKHTELLIEQMSFSDLNKMVDYCDKKLSLSWDIKYYKLRGVLINQIDYMVSLIVELDEYFKTKEI